MAQQPNIELDMTARPRPTPGTDPARPWMPGRPGEITGTGAPWGGAFGTPGPDAGYALKLVAERDLVLADHEHRADADAVVAGVAAARASRMGRGPTAKDVDAAIVILGYDAPGDSAALRAAVIGGAAHHHPERVRHLVAGIPADVFDASIDELKERRASGESLVEI